jgi:hypothetical protein
MGGGGIEIQGGTVTISQSMIVNNGGGSQTGGVQMLGGELTLINSTVARNAVGAARGTGGVTVGGGTVRMLNATIVENHGSGSSAPTAGGIWVGNARAELHNTIVAHNTKTSLGLASDCQGSLTSLGHNVIGDPAGCAIALQPTDLIGDPVLDSYADDGMPGRGHYPPLPDSPVIDAGNDMVCPSTDQLGQPRVGRCDIGSVEFQGPSAPPSLALRLNQSQFTGAGQTLVANLSVEHTGPDILTDFYFALLLPDGVTLIFVLGGENWVWTRLDASPSTFVPWVPNAPIPRGTDVEYDFWSYTFYGAEPPGTYVTMLMLTKPGAFQDGRIDDGDILAMDTQAFEFIPQVASR